MKARVFKIGAFVIALAVVIATAFVTGKPVMAAETEYDTLLQETATAYAGESISYAFTVDHAETVTYSVIVPERVGFTISVKNSAGVEIGGGELHISAEDNWIYNSGNGLFGNGASLAMSSGDYTVTLTFDENTQYVVVIMEPKVQPTINYKEVTITAGFTQQLSVADGTVESWKSDKTSVATVNNKGVVTAKKAGKATITAVLSDGTELECVVTIKANKYTDTKITNGNVEAEKCTISAYNASFDSKGNLVIKTSFVNNTYNKVTKLKNLKIVVTDANNKTVGTYTIKSKNVTVPSISSKSLTFTIKKADLKIKKADLRNCKIDITGSYAGYKY